MKQTKRFQFFLVSGVLISLINLVIYNDAATVWGGAEAELLRSGLDNSQPYFLPSIAQKILTGDLSFNIFLSRLPSVFFIVLSAILFYLLSKPIFGSQTSFFTLLVGSTTLIIPHLGKIASADSWLFFSQLLAWLALLRFLKQPKEKWRITAFAALLLSLWLQPLSTILLFSVGSWWLYRFHPEGLRILLINPWIVLVSGGIALFILGNWQWERPAYLTALFSLSFRYYLLLIAGAFFPLLGFFLAGIKDTFIKLRRKEELAIITSAWLLGSLAGQSLLFVAGAALIVAKQMTLYFQPHYPHRTLVRMGAILHLMVAFFGITLLMLFSMKEFGGLGFRSALSIGIIYWGLSFISVIGLFGNNYRFTFGGSLMNGILITLIFWLQIYPFIEAKRNWPKRLDLATQNMGFNTQANLYIHQLPASEKEKVNLYLEPLFKKIVFTEEDSQFLEFYHNAHKNAFLVPVSDITQLESIKDSLRIEGWTDKFQKLELILIRN